MFLLWIYDKIISLCTPVYYVETRKCKNGMERYISRRIKKMDFQQERISIDYVLYDKQIRSLCYHSYVHNYGLMVGWIYYMGWLMYMDFFGFFLPCGFCDVYTKNDAVIGVSVYFPLPKRRLYWSHCFLHPNHKNDILFAHILHKIITSNHVKIRLGIYNESSKRNIGGSTMDTFW